MSRYGDFDSEAEWLDDQIRSYYRSNDCDINGPCARIKERTMGKREGYDWTAAADSAAVHHKQECAKWAALAVRLEGQGIMLNDMSSCAGVSLHVQHDCSRRESFDALGTPLKVERVRQYSHTTWKVDPSTAMSPSQFCMVVETGGDEEVSRVSPDQPPDTVSVWLTAAPALPTELTARTSTVWVPPPTTVSVKLKLSDGSSNVPSEGMPP